MLDKELITRFREHGDRTALHEIALRYTKRCYNVALGILGDTGAAEDAVQQAFLNLIKNISMYKGTSSFSTWFYRIVVNCALEVRRSEQRRKHREGVAAENLQRRKNMQTEENFKAEVKNAVFSLPDNLRLPVVLHYYNGLSYSETASALNCPEGSVASRLHRASIQIPIRGREHNKFSNCHHKEAYFWKNYVLTLKIKVTSGQASAVVRANKSDQGNMNGTIFWVTADSRWHDMKIEVEDDSAIFYVDGEEKQTAFPEFSTGLVSLVLAPNSEAEFKNISINLKSTSKE